MDALFEAIVGKVRKERTIIAALLFGSRARRQVTPSSDIDFQILSSRPKVLGDKRWFACDNFFDIILISNRRATGGAIKITVLYSCGLVDIVLPRYVEMVIAKLLVGMRVYRQWGFLYDRLRALAVIIGPGFDVIKGGPSWARFYNQVAQDVLPARLDNLQVGEIAKRCYLDAYWAYRKAKDGELLAAQRWLHRVPFEANVDLLNELRLRRGLQPCYDARRSEMQLPLKEQELIRIEAALDSESLCHASVLVVENMRKLVKMLTGEEPVWPRF